MGKTLEDIGIANIILNNNSYDQIIQARTEKCDRIKFKILCTSKETVIILKGQPEEWEKGFANCFSEKTWKFRIYKECKN
jgi:hypothetical protein